MSTTGAIEATLQELQRRSLSIGADHLLAARLLGLERTLERLDLIRHCCGLNDSVQPSRTALHTRPNATIARHIACHICTGTD